MESEKQTERYLSKKIIEIGGLCRKFVSPGIRNVPDRICVLPGGKVVWVELKSEGVKPREGQVREIKRLQLLGHDARFIDKKCQVDDLIKEILKWNL